MFSSRLYVRHIQLVDCAAITSVQRRSPWDHRAVALAVLAIAARPPPSGRRRRPSSATRQPPTAWHRPAAPCQVRAPSPLPRVWSSFSPD